jgi:hypothetical protein
MRNDQKGSRGVDRVVPAACAVATIAGAIVWSNAVLLVGLAVVSLAGSVGPFAHRARERAEATAVQLAEGRNLTSA